MTPDHLNEIEAMAKVTLLPRSVLLADVLALVARVRELQAKNICLAEGWKHSEIGWRNDRDLARASWEKAEARVKELEREDAGAYEGLWRRTCSNVLQLEARVAVLHEALKEIGDWQAGYYADHGSEGIRAAESLAEGAQAALATLDPAATAITERLKAAEAVCEAADKEHQSGWSQHDRYACDVCIGIYAWQNAKGEP